MRIYINFRYPYPSRIWKAYILGSKDKTKDIDTNTIYRQITKIITNSEQNFVTLMPKKIKKSKKGLKWLNKMSKGSTVVNKIQFV